MDKKKLVIGVIGADVHAVGISILQHAFEEAGFEVVNLGVMVSQEEYIAAAIETNADAILVHRMEEDPPRQVYDLPALETLLGRRLRVSPSQLEKYYTCRYGYFCKVSIAEEKNCI